MLVRTCWLAILLLLTACSGETSSESGRLTPAPTSSTTAPTSTTSTTVTTSTTSTTTTVPKAPPPPGLVDVQDLERSIVVALNKLTGDNITGQPLPG